MKVEPVAYRHYISDNEDKESVVVDFERFNAMAVHDGTTPLYAIPPGYALVRVEQVKDARLLAWLLEKHGEQIRQILWSYYQCCSDEINALGVKAMLTAAAKGE